MAIGFYHGVETKELLDGSRPVIESPSAVIGLIGTAPRGGAPDTLTLVKNRRDAAAFGFVAAENTIASALDHIFSQGDARVLVVNIYDESNTDHWRQMSTDYTLAGGKIRVRNRVYASDLVVKTTAVTPVTLVAGTDYTWDQDTQTLTIADRATYPDGTDLTLEFKALTTDFSDYLDSEVMGSVLTNSKTGLEKLVDAFNQLGIKARNIIAPRFSHRPAVADKMLEIADKVQAMAYLDAPAGVALGDALGGRGSSAGAVQNFSTNDERAVLCFPYLIALDPMRNAEVGYPLSEFLAGVVANTDNELGYWYSPSNKTVRGAIRTETLISWDPNNATGTDGNELGAAGIVTAVAGYGTDLTIWGNRSAAFPDSASPKTFISVRRTVDMILDNLARATVRFVDRPITIPVITAIKETGNKYINTLISQGALIGGSVVYDPAKNPPSVTTSGQIIFDLDLLPPAPAERITYQTFVNPALATALNAAAE